MRRAGALTLLSTALFAAELVGEVSPPQKVAARAPAVIQPEPLADSPSWTWAGPQFVQADKQGRVFLLKGDGLEIFKISGAGKVTANGRLEVPPGLGFSGVPDEAVLSSGGAAWRTLEFSGRVLDFSDPKNPRPAQSEWVVSSLTAGSSEPIVSVLPAKLGRDGSEGIPRWKPPLLASWDGKKWISLVAGEIEQAEESVRAAAPPSFLSLRAKYALASAQAPNRHLWVVDRYRYRLRHYSPSGVLREVVTVPNFASDANDINDEVSARGGGDVPPTEDWSSKPVVQALGVAPDGTVYLLVETGSGLALDRYPSAEGRLERTLLQGVDLGVGKPTIAATRSEIYFAARLGSQGLWRIDNEVLQTARWQEVAGVTTSRTVAP